MKKQILLAALSALILAFSCEKEGEPETPAVFKNQKSELLRDWIGLHLQVIKNTSGVTHIAFGRHFAYTGVALYESLVRGDKQYKSIAGSLNGQVQLPEPPQGKPLYWPASANAAMAEMLRFFYSAKPENVQRIDSLEAVYFAKYSTGVNPATDLAAAVQFGKQIAQAVIEWSKQDGADGANIPYTPLGEGYWEPTSSAPANMPGWVNNRTILPGSIHNTMPVAPTSFSKDPGTPFYNMAKEVYDISQSLTEEQKAIANFWDDAPNGNYVTVFGHWFSILKQVFEKDNPGLMKAADAYLRLGISMHEAVISCWKTKYTYHLIRPVTYIRKHIGHADWNTFIVTPPHPEYSSAHASFSGAAGYALESVFGQNYGFTDHTYDVLGMPPRKFNSFDAAAKEAAISRLYGGIHYRATVEVGNTQGKKVGENVKNLLTTRK
ncbi:MAG: vanadium-dependent haloperoxidase [Saprospiraceae bacterium]|nr:vanadium-dependent haloperoxidase [Saprospiraceae bacterium]